MIVPAAEAVITKGRRYVGRAVADIVAKVGSFNTRVCSPGCDGRQDRMPGNRAAWVGGRRVFGCDLPLPLHGAATWRLGAWCPARYDDLREPSMRSATLAAHDDRPRDGPGAL